MARNGTTARKVEVEETKAGTIEVEIGTSEIVIRARFAENPALSQTGKSRILAATQMFASLGDGLSLNLMVLRREKRE